MVLHLSNLPLGDDIVMAKALSITIVRTMSASTVEALCATDVVQRVSEEYLKEDSTKWKKSRLQMESNTPNLLPLQLALSISRVRGLICNRYGINFERSNAAIEQLTYNGLILKPYKMWVGYPVQELTHLPISSAVEIVEAEIVGLLSRERKEAGLLADYQT